MSSVFDGAQFNRFVHGDGIDHRVAVRAATTATLDLNSNLNGATVDGVTLAADDRILVKNQVTSTQETEVTTVADAAGSLNNTYFFISTPTTDYYVWINVGAAGTDPAIAGRTGIEVTIATNANASAVATGVQLAVDATLDFTAGVLANVVTINTVVDASSPSASVETTPFTITENPGSGALDHGIWIVGSAAGESYRAEDLIIGENAAGLHCRVLSGTVNGRTSWTQVETTATVGTDTLTWIQDGIYNYSANELIYASAGDQLSSLATTADRNLTSDASGVPQWTTELAPGSTVSGPFTLSSQVVNKGYVDSAAAGLDPKESVRIRTLTDIGGTYNAVGGTGGTGEFTGVDLTSAVAFDLAGALQIGDRVLVMDQTDPLENGIYSVTVAGAAGALERAADQDGSPASEVSSGNFTFVEVGATYASTGWVLQGDGLITLNTDALDWVQFSSPGNWNALDGITISGANISVDALTNGGIVFNGASPDGQLQVDLGASAITGTVDETHGGTGQTTYAVGDLLVGGAVNTLSKLSTTARKVLTTDTGGVVSWRNVAHLQTILGDSALEPELLQFSNTNAAVNNLQIANAITAVNPRLQAVGGDANVGLALQSKGTGSIEILGDSAAGAVRWFNAAQTFSAGLQAGALTSNVTWTLPLADGINGEVLKTDGAGQLSFTSLSAASRMVVPLVTIQGTGNTTALTPIGYFDWDDGEFTGTTSLKVFYHATIPGGKTLEVELFNETTGLAIGSDSQTADGFFNFTITPPSADARLAFRIRKTTPGGSNPQIYGVSLIFNPTS